MTDEPLPPDVNVDPPPSGSLKVTTEWPYRLLLISDFTGAEGGTISGGLADEMTSVNAGSFDELLAQSRPTIQFKTTDPTRPGNVMVGLELAFSSMRDFDPVRLAAQIPASAALLKFRERLLARLKGSLSADQLREAAQSASAADAGLAWVVESLAGMEQGPAPQAVDSVLSQLDLGDGAPPPSATNAAIAAAAGQGAAVAPEEAAALRKTLAELDRRVSLWLNRVLHSPPLQALEAAWRGLQFLVTHMEFRKGLRLSVLHARRAELTERFTKLLIDPVFDEGVDAPDLILVDHAFGNTANDTAALDELAQNAASLPAVLVTGLSPGFLGVKQMRQITTLPPIISLIDQWQFAKWKSLRDKPYGRALGVVLGRGLLRLPSDGESGTELDYAFKEDCQTEADLVWSTGAIGLGCTVAQSFAETAWPVAMAGHLHGQVEGFKTTTGGPKGDKRFGPTDVELPQNRIDELGVAGVNVLMNVRDGALAVLANGLTAGRATAPTQGGLLEVSLPYQLFAARISALLLALKPHVEQMESGALAAAVTTHLRDWLGLKGEVPADQLSVQVRPTDDGGRQVAVNLAPPEHLLPGGIPLVLGLRVS